MKNLTINAKNHTIEMNKAFTAAASVFGSDEYNQLQTARRDYPTYPEILDFGEDKNATIVEVGKSAKSYALLPTATLPAKTA